MTIKQINGRTKEALTAGLIMAILGGSVLPPMQASIIDMGTFAGMPAVNASFVLPLICFIVITIYGYRSYRRSL